MASAQNDSAALVDPLSKIIIAYTSGPIIHEHFWREYSTDAIVDEIIAAAGTSRLPTLDFSKWWAEWIKRQEDFDEAKKAELVDAVMYDAELFGKPISSLQIGENGTPRNQLARGPVKAMLYDMGILKDKRGDTK